MNEQLNYVDVNFLQKELKERIQPEENHYAEIIRHEKTEKKLLLKQSSSTSNEEIIYRLKNDLKFEKPKLHAKTGDIFLSQETPKNGLIIGTLLQVAAKNNYHSGISIPIEHLVVYTPDKIQYTPPPLYEDMSDFKSTKNEFEELSKYFQEFSPKTPPPSSPPSMEKVKVVTKQKLTKLKSDFIKEESEVACFAVAERKSSSKEKSILSYKRKQPGILLFSSACGWWLVKQLDGAAATIGWVPADHWRVMPENLDDVHSSSAYRPWLASSKVEPAEMEQKLLATGQDRNFVFVHDKNEEVYILLVKRPNEIYKFKVSILADKKLLFSGRYFQTLDNVVLYFKRVSLKIDTSHFTLGCPFCPTD